MVENMCRIVVLIAVLVLGDEVEACHAASKKRMVSPWRFSRPNGEWA
jgi:hypothetical protein